MARFHVSSRPRTLMRVNAALEKDDKNSGKRDRKIKKLRTAGFDGLLKLRLKVMKVETVRSLCDRFDWEIESFRLDDTSEPLPITADDVHRIYALPMGKRLIDIDELDGELAKEGVASLQKELGIKSSHVSITEIRKLLNDCRSSTKFAKLYILYALGTLLAPSSDRLVSLSYGHFLEPFSGIKEYNWARHVRDRLVYGLTKYSRAKTKTKPTGDLHLMVIHCLDHTKGDGKDSRAPTCSRWSKLPEHWFGSSGEKTEQEVEEEEEELRCEEAEEELGCEVEEEEELRCEEAEEELGCEEEEELQCEEAEEELGCEEVVQRRLRIAELEFLRKESKAQAEYWIKRMVGAEAELRQLGVREEKGREKTRRPKRRRRENEAKGGDEAEGGDEDEEGEEVKEHDCIEEFLEQHQTDDDTLGECGEDMIDPWSISTMKDLLEELNPRFTKYDGYISSAEPYSGKVTLSSIGNAPRNKIIDLGGLKYRIKELAGKGGFAQVYKAYVNSNPDDVVALKIQKPAFPWEFHMLRQLDLRVAESERSAFGRTRKMHVFQDCSILVCDYLPYGTLQDLINSYVVPRKPMEEVLCIYYTREMLYMLEHLHNAGILHGDFKADNLLIRYASGNLSEEGFLDRGGLWASQGLCLVDWGRGIDLNLFPDSIVFSGDCRTSGFRCVQMQEKKPWKYRVDTYGLCVVVHMMLHGSYMEVVKKSSSAGSFYEPKTTLRRYWKVDLWKNLFSKLLNMDQTTYDPGLLKDIRHSFEDYLRSNPRLIRDLKNLLVKLRASLRQA